MIPTVWEQRKGYPVQSFGAKVRRGCWEGVATLQTLKAKGWWQVVSEEGAVQWVLGI